MEAQRTDLQRAAAQLHEAPDLLLFVDYDSVASLARRNDAPRFLERTVPERLVAAALDLGRLRRSTAYSKTERAAPWRRYGFATKPRAHLELDVLEQVLATKTRVDVALLVTGNRFEADLLRRLRRAVRLVAVSAPAAAAEEMKRCADLFVLLETYLEDEPKSPVLTATPTTELFCTVMADLGTTLNFIGVNHLVKHVMPAHGIRTKDARGALAELERSGVIEVYRDDKKRRCCRFTEEHSGAA